MLGYFDYNFGQSNLSDELEKLRLNIMNNSQPIWGSCAVASFDASLEDKKPMSNSNHPINLIGEHKFLTLKVRS